MELKAEYRTKRVKYVFLDIVKYTVGRSVEAQSDIVELLNGIVVKAVNEAGLTKEDTLYLPTGDGMGIGILGEAVEFDIHLRLSLKILSELAKLNQTASDEMRQFGIRIGLNENVDNLIQDINGNKNVAGAGINMAQRVMSKADENQLLVGQAVYDTLIQREKYMSSFRKYEARVKHGARLFVYQFCEEDHDGLSIDVPTAFAPEELREHRLTDLEAYFVGLSIKHQAFLIENNGQGQHHYALILLLWFLAKDEVEKRNATATKPAYSRVAGMGKLSLYEIFNEYMKMDFWACNNLANFIIEKHFSLREYFEASPTALIFANEDAATKLRANRPDIYESLDLDTG